MEFFFFFFFTLFTRTIIVESMPKLFECLKTWPHQLLLQITFRCLIIKNTIISLPCRWKGAKVFTVPMEGGLGIDNISKSDTDLTS